MSRATRYLLIGATALWLPACVAVAPPMNAQEQDMAASLEVNQYMPASREMRDNIETQELFAQAAFWGHEYDLNPSDLEAAIKLAAAVRKLGNPSRAVEITQTSRAIHPRDPYLLAEHAAGLIADERALDAVPVLDSGLRLTPQYARLWSLKGAALDQLEDYGAARQHYARALQITPEDPNILANLGLSHALAGDPATAEQWLRRAAAQPGAGAGVRQNLALVLQLQGKTEDSQRHARAARQSRGDQMLPRAQPVPAFSPRPAPGAQATPARRAAPQPPAQQPKQGFRAMPQARLNMHAPDGQQFRSAADAARHAAMQRQQAGQAPVSAAPLPGPNEMTTEQRDVLAQIARNVGPQAAAPQAHTSASTPYVVGPALRAPGQSAPLAGGPAYAAPSYGAPAPQRRGAARRR